MKKIICLRDDDTSYFTTAQELQYAYQGIWNHYPITLATIPFTQGSHSKMIEFGYMPNKEKLSLLDQYIQNASLAELEDYYQIHFIGKNAELVDFLMPYIKNNKVEIAQHGVHHSFFNDGPEMANNHTTFQDIKAGKDYLEKLFQCKINIFIPPSNTIDSHSISHLKKLHMELFCSGSIYFANQTERVFLYLKYPYDFFDGMKNKIFKKAKPIINRNGINRYCSFTFGIQTSKNEYTELVYNQLNHYGYVSLASHYWTLCENEKYRKDYLEIINGLANTFPEAEFVTGSQYRNYLMKDYKYL